jgi:putative ABC transport system permease protein
MVPVSYEFIDIKGLEFEKEDFIMNQSEFRGKCIVLGSEIASSLLKQ